MTRVQELEQLKGFAAPNLTQQASRIFVLAQTYEF
jgi:hypothetical protein